MRRTEDRGQILFGKPFVNTKENKIHFQFDAFYTFLETNEMERHRSYYSSNVKKN